MKTKTESKPTPGPFTKSNRGDTPVLLDAEGNVVAAFYGGWDVRLRDEAAIASELVRVAKAAQTALWEAGVRGHEAQQALREVLAKV
jgi:hypothetical protein